MNPIPLVGFRVTITFSIVYVAVSLNYLCYADFPDGGPGMFDDLTDEGSSSNLFSPPPPGLTGPPQQSIRRGSIHSEYDVLPEELGRYVEMREGRGERDTIRRRERGKRISKEKREEWKRGREVGDMDIM